MADATTIPPPASAPLPALTPLAGLVVGEDAGRRGTAKWTAIGLAVLALTFGGSVLWSTLVPLSSAVVAQGAVKVESSRKKIQHPEGGVVRDILVKDGDVVKAGDVLLRMDETRAGAAHGVVQGSRDVATATLARLHAERDDRAGIGFPADLLRRAATDPLLAQTLKAQEALFSARRSARAGEINIVDQQIGALRSEITGLETQRQARQEQVQSLENDLKGLVELDAVGMVEKTKLRALERDISRVRGERDELTSRIASTRTAISEKDLRKFQVRKAFQEDVSAELKKVQSENFELLERESTTKRTLELTELKSPVAGTVTELKVHTAGGVVSPGEVLMEVVPSDDRLSVEARVLPQDIDRVATGQPAGVKVHAFNSRTTPELNASVKYVAADATTDPRTEQSWFLVKVDVPAEEIKRLGAQQRLQPGMQADIFIRTGERTFWGYLMQPLADSFRKAWRER